MASTISIQAGIIPHCKALTHGAIAVSVLSHISKALLKGDTAPIALSDLATMTASKLEDVITTCAELEAKGLVSNNVEGVWSEVSSVTPYGFRIMLAVGQKGLSFGEGSAKPEPKNPLGLFLGHDYKRIGGAGSMTFRGYESDDGIYQFHSPSVGGLRGDESWVRSVFDLLDVPSWDPKIPQEEGGLDMPELNEEGLRVYRVSPERFVELANCDASKTLSAKNPTAKELVMLSDVEYVVTGVAVLPGATADKIYLTPCISAARGDKDGQFFKVGKNRYKLGRPDERITVMLAPLEEVAMAPVDVVAWVKDFAARGFLTEGAVTLKERSYRAVCAAAFPGQEVSDLNEGCLVEGIVVRYDRDGSEIEGYEESEAEPEPEVEAEPQDGSAGEGA